MKKLFAIAFAVVLCFALGVVAMAETGPFTVTGGAENTDYRYWDNKLEILTATPLTISTAGPTSDRIEIVDENITADITLSVYNGGAIKTQGGSYIASLNLKLIGNNTVTVSATTGDVYGIKINGTLSITDGDGNAETTPSLTVNSTTDNATEDGRRTCGINGGADVTIDGVTVTVNAEAKNKNLAFEGITSSEDVKIDDSTVTITCKGNGEVSGTLIGENVSIENSNVTAKGANINPDASTAVRSYGIQAYSGNVTIENSTVHATGGSVTNTGTGQTKSYGIYGETGITMTGTNNVTAASGTVDEGGISFNYYANGVHYDTFGTPFTGFKNGIYYVNGVEKAGITHTNHTGWTAFNGGFSADGAYYLENNVTVSNNISVNCNVALCLNGKTLDLGNTKIEIGSGSKLTVCDCSADKTGKITSTNGGETIINCGELVITGGTVENTGGGKGIGDANGTSVTVSGGKIIANGIGINKSSVGTVTVSGDAKIISEENQAVNVSNGAGVFVDGTAEIKGKVTGIYAVNTSGNTSTSVTVSGGTVTGNTGIFIYTNSGATASLTVTGGTVSGKNYDIVDGGDVTFDLGNFNGTVRDNATNLLYKYTDGTYVPYTGYHFADGLLYEYTGGEGTLYSGYFFDAEGKLYYYTEGIGTLYTGEYEGKLYGEGVLFTGYKLVEGKLYSYTDGIGELFTGYHFADGKLYSYTEGVGTLYTGEYDGKKYKDGVEVIPEEPKPEPCDHRLDENGKCSRCGVVIISYPREEGEINPGTGAPTVGLAAILGIMAFNK